MSSSHKPSWQLPIGVSRATWDYLQSEHIATEYDSYFADSALMRLDIDILRQHLPNASSRPAPIVADLGCGTGRVSRQLLPLGYEMLNVDLSEAMLREVVAQCPPKFQSRNRCQLANLVEIDRELSPQSLDMAVCLFSSIGMIRGWKNRQRFLLGVHRALRPQAKFFVHVHNRYRSLLDPGGPRWLVQSYMSSLLVREAEFGDRIYAYRRLPSMFLHIFSSREIRTGLQRAGFKNIRLMPINFTGTALLKRRLASGVLAGGYFAIGEVA